MIKNIFYVAVMALGLASCADMLQQDDDLTMTPEQNALSTPNDTIFSVTGTITLMQKVMDRVNILGEVRGDLVQCTPDASRYLQNLSAFNLDSVGQYNNVADYYAIINNCNYFISKVDTGYSKHGQSIFLREYAVMKTYRAWTYLQLALNYGDVPFYTHFLASANDGLDVLAQDKRDIKYICNELIDDIAPFIETPFPAYGSINNKQSRKFFIPVRLMLGDLCLYAGRYREAAQYYHDFITHPDDPWRLPKACGEWNNEDVSRVGDLKNWNARGSIRTLCSPGGTECIAYIPFETAEQDGTVSYLDDIYNSTEDNNYFYQLTASEALFRLSESQNHCVEGRNTANVAQRDTVIVHPGDTILDYRADYGDLRLSCFMPKHKMVTGATTQYSKERQTIYGKFDEDGQSLFRLTQVYLHYAEALNRAGFPSAAMVILKYGVCPEHMADYVSQYERDNAGTLLTFNSSQFPRVDTNGNVVAYSIHSRGCGDSQCDTTYVLPMPDHQLATMADTIEYQIPLVEDMIIDESALECSFEGARFNDLIRVAMRRNNPAYLADRVAMRTGTLDAALRAKLMTPKNWYLPLPR